MDTIESATAKGNTGDALDLPRPHRSVGSQLFGDRLMPCWLSAPAPMPSVCSPAPMPSIVLYTAPERHVRGVPLVVPPQLEQILDREVRGAQVEQVHKLRPHPIVLAS